MGDENRGAPPHDLLEPRGHLLFRFGVEGRRRLVEHQHRRGGQQRARHRQPLPLARRQGRSALAHHRRATLRQRRQQPRQPRRAGCGQHLVVGRLGTRIADVLGDRGVEHRRLLLHQRHPRAQVAQPERAQVAPVEAHRPRVGVEEPQHEIDDGALPAAARADDGEAGARGRLQRDVFEHRRAAVERQGDVVQLQLAAHRGQRRRARCLDHFRLDVQNLVHPPQRHPHRREAGVQPHQRLHRGEQAQLIGHERHEGAQRQRAVDDPLPPVQEHQRGAARQHQPRQAARQVGGPLHGHQGVDEPPVAGAEAPHLAFLRVGGDHQPHPLQGLDEEAADVGAPLAQRRDPRLEAAAVAHQGPHAGGQGGGTEQQQPHVEVGQHDDRPDQEQHVAHPRQHDLGRHALDFADVVVQPRHDVAEPGPRMEPRRQPLQVAVEGEAHVEEDVGRHPRVAQPAPDVQPEPRRGDRGEQQHHQAQGAGVAGENRAVDQGARKQRHRQREAGRDEAEHHDQGQPPPVGRQIRERAAQVRIDHG